MNRPSASLLERGVIEHLIGVIDLKEGCAVHAVAGKRRRYLPVSLPGHVDRGNPDELTAFYAALGVRQLYIADLDAIEKRSLQASTVEIMRRVSGQHFGRVLLDLGWRGDEDESSLATIRRLVAEFPSLCLIAATESAVFPDAPARLSSALEGSRVYLGLDYRGGKWIGRNVSEYDSIRAAAELPLTGIVVLDLESVGTARGPTTPAIVRRIRNQYPVGTVVSGGGIRSADDARKLLRAGCDDCLVATALYNCR